MDGQGGRQMTTKLKPWRTKMITKSLIAAAAVAVSLTALAPVQQAQAKVNVDINLGLGGGYYPGYGYGGGYYPVYEPYYGGGKSCWQVKHKLKNMNFKHVQPYDCSAPTYRFTAKKNGNHVNVKTNVWGNILAVW
jgi:hypothetical protein